MQSLELRFPLRVSRTAAEAERIDWSRRAVISRSDFVFTAIISRPPHCCARQDFRIWESTESAGPKTPTPTHAHTEQSALTRQKSLSFLFRSLSFSFSLSHTLTFPLSVSASVSALSLSANCVISFSLTLPSLCLCLSLYSPAPTLYLFFLVLHFVFSLWDFSSGGGHKFQNCLHSVTK